MTNPLIVVRPVSVTDAMLISTDVTEADYAAWSAVTVCVVSSAKSAWFLNSQDCLA